MTKPSFGERFRYWFDNVMAKGAGALIGLLALVTLAFILVVAIIVEIFGIFPVADNVVTPLDFAEVVWGNLMRAMDAGTVAGDVGWGFRALMLLVTLFGILTVASLIGIVSGAFDERVAELRKGRSKVLEKDHTLILGWSSKVVPIVSEVCTANLSRGRATIVILADRDKVEMEDELRDRVGRRGKTRIIVRSGDPMNLTDLEIANPHGARSIVILPPDDSDDPDSIVIKTTLAITNNPRRKDGRYHIVAEIEEAKNLEAARLVGRDEAHWIEGDELISRIAVQSARQSGLSVVYSELLDFEGDEIYFTEQPTLWGKTYFETQLHFVDSTVIGMIKGGVVQLNPAPEALHEAGDQLIVIAEDDSTIRLATPGVVEHEVLSTAKEPKVKPERTLVLGYNAGLTVMLDELSQYVAKGSTVTVVADTEVPDLPSYANMAVTVRREDTTSRSVLNSLDVGSFHHIIVLAYSEELDVQQADSRTLITLLHLRDMEDKDGLDLKVVSEMLDDRNRELAEVTKADDFIVSEKLISLVMSQVSENRELIDVFSTLFSAEGSEVYLKPAEYYITPGAETDFYSVLEAARRLDETAIGYRVAADARTASKTYGVRLNPKKTDRVTFAAGDKVIVLAED